MGMNLYVQHWKYLQACYMVVTRVDTWNFFIILYCLSINFASLTIVMFMSQHHHSIKCRHEGIDTYPDIFSCDRSPVSLFWLIPLFPDTLKEIRSPTTAWKKERAFVMSKYL